MIKKKFFSFQYLSSDRLHQINFSVLNILASFALILIIFIGANYYLSVGFSNQYYQDKLKETDEKYADVSQELLAKITQLEQELLLIEERDKELRTYAAIPPLSEDIKIQGTGGSVEETSIEDKDATSILFQLKDKIDSLSYTVNLEKDSYSTIFNKIKSNEKMYSHIPSISPVEAYLGSGYGYRTDPIDGKRRMHRGLDFAVNLNTDVIATGDGVVKKAQYDSGWGRYVKIDHGYGYETIYAHLYKINVKKGQKIKRGDLVGKSGNSGRAAGFHLHYEVHKSGVQVDPINFFYNDLTPAQFDRLLKMAAANNQSLD